MIIEVEIDDKIIEQEFDDVGKETMLDLIDTGIRCITRVSSYYKISDSDIKLTIKQ